MRVLVAVDQPRGAAIAHELAPEGVEVVAVVAADALALAGEDAAYGSDARTTAAALGQVEAVLLQADRRTLTAAAVALCDRHGVRILALCAHDADRPLVDASGLSSALALSDPGWRIAGIGADLPPSAPFDSELVPLLGSLEKPRIQVIAAAWDKFGPVFKTTLAKPQSSGYQARASCPKWAIVLQKKVFQ